MSSPINNRRRFNVSKDEVEIVFENFNNIETISYGNYKDHDKFAFINKFTYDKPKLINPKVRGTFSFYVKDLVTDQRTRSFTITVEPTEETTTIIYGCTDPEALNYDETANTDDGTCLREGDTPDYEKIESKIRDALRIGIEDEINSINLETSLESVSVPLKDGDRFLKYSLIDNFGNNEPILNYVKGGNLQQVESEIDVLDSIVVKLEKPIDTSVQRLQFTEIYKTEFLPIEFNIDFSEDVDDKQLTYLSPNFTSEINNQTINEFSDFENFNSLTAVDTENIIDFYLQRDKFDINLNTDFTDFKNFVKFSSAKERLENFYYKVQLLESFNSQSNSIEQIPSSTYKTNQLLKLSESIRTTKNSFDDYEYFLYNDSGSFYSSSFVSSSDGIYASWPKENSTTLYHTSHSIVQNWFDNFTIIAEDYDNLNRDSFQNNTPEYVRNDSNSDEYVLFVNMVGHLMDEIYIHIKELSKLYEWDNNRASGLSGDLSIVLLDMFANNLDTSFADKSLWEYLLGVKENETSISTLNNDLTFKEQQSETLRRLLTNLPHLLKTKGTKRGIRGLIKSYGIPESTLKIQEYGTFQTPTGIKNEEFVEETAYKLRIGNAVSDRSQIRLINDSSINGVKAIETTFEYNGSTEEVTIFRGTTPSNESYDILISGSDESNGHIVLNITDGLNSFELSSDPFPIYNGNVYNTLVQQVDSGEYQILVNQYDVVRDEFNTRILNSGSVSSSILSSIDNVFDTIDTFTFGNDGGSNVSFVGDLHELRLWKTELTQNNFDSHTKYPKSITLNNALDIPTSLAVRVDFESEFNSSLSSGFIPNLVFDPSYPTRLILGGFSNTNNYLTFTRDVRVVSPNIGNDVLGNNKVRFGLNQQIDGNVLTPSNQNQNKENEPFTTVLTRFERSSDAIGNEIDSGDRNRGDKIKSINITLLDENIDIYEVTESGFIEIENTSGEIQRLELINGDSIDVTITNNFTTIYTLIVKEDILNYDFEKFTVYPINAIEEEITINPIPVLQSNEIINNQINDSNELVIGFSPTDILNQIIIQHFGDTDFVDQYGDPREQFTDEYPQLKQLIEDFFSNISNEYKTKFYIDYIRNFDKTLFNNIKKFIPEKAKLTTGIFIEPHLLDRSKAKRLGKNNNSANQTQDGRNISDITNFDGSGNQFVGQTDILVYDSTEGLIADAFNIQIQDEGEATIIRQNEIARFLNQNTMIIILSDKFEDDIINYITPEQDMIVRVRNANNQQFTFEFRKFGGNEFLLEINDISKIIDGIPINERNNSNQTYVNAVSNYNELFNLFGKLFLIKYPYTGTKPGIAATLEDLPNDFKNMKITGSGINEEFRSTKGGQTSSNDSLNTGQPPVVISRSNLTQTIVTQPDEDVKLTVQ